MLKSKKILFVVLAVLACLSFAAWAEATVQSSRVTRGEVPAIQTYYINAQAGEHGRITPPGTVKVTGGSDQTFVILPDIGYRIAEVKIDGVSEGRRSTYTFFKVTASHSIIATFVTNDWGAGLNTFYSAAPRGGGFLGGDVTANAPEGRDGNNQRSIEEGDLAKLYGTTLFVLNQYRGLQIIDVTDPNNPLLLSTVEIYGNPVELYVRGDTAYVVVSNYVNYRYSPLGAFTESFQGSRLAVVDVREKRSPQISAGIDIEGSITDTRMVGDILYVVANRYAYNYVYPLLGTGSPTTIAPVPIRNENLTTVTSVSIADPAQVTVVDELSFETANNSYENNVHVTADKVFLAQYRYGSMDNNGNWIENSATDITCIDIADEQGVIRQGRTFTVPGVISNRWQMDFYNGYFRAITPQQSWGNGFPSLYMYRVQNPETIRLVSKLTLVLDRPESLMSVRFDGNSAYAVTYERIDPLFTLDLTDPAHPRQLAEIEMTGWIDYIEPRTDHLVTLGHDDAGGNIALAVSLFDVTSLANPIMVERVNVGEGWGWVPTEMNDIHKAFKVLDDLHLIIIPFSSWSSTDNRELSGAQLIDYFFDTQAKGLEKRGLIQHSGWIERAIPYDPTTVLTVSQEAFQSVDISDRDNPAIRKVLELARNAIDISGLTRDQGIELSASNPWYSYGQSTSTLSVVPLDNPNTSEPSDALQVRGFFDQLYSMQGAHLVVGYRYDEVKGNVTVLKTVTYDNNGLRTPGSLEVEGINNYCGVYASYRSLVPYRPASQAVQISDTAVVLVGNECFYPILDYRGSSATYDLVLKAVDVSNPQSLKVASTVNLDFQDGFTTHTMWQGAKAYITYALPFTEDQGLPYYRYYLKIVDLSDIESPLVSPAINTPGNVIGASNNGRYVYTVDYQYAPPSFGYGNEVYLNTVEIIGDQAYLKDREKIVPAPESEHEYSYCGNVVVNDEKVYFVVTRTVCDPDYSRCQGDSKLVTADLADPENIQVPSSQNLEVQGADIIKAVHNKLFLYTYNGAGGIIIYSLADPLNPTYESFYPTTSYPDKIVVIDDKAYLPSGMYGTKVVHLN